MLTISETKFKITKITKKLNSKVKYVFKHERKIKKNTMSDKKGERRFEVKLDGDLHW